MHQTRAYFLHKLGRIVDEPRVGQELADTYWVGGTGWVAVRLWVWCVEESRVGGRRGEAMAPGAARSSSMASCLPSHTHPSSPRAMARPSWTW